MHIDEQAASVPVRLAVTLGRLHRRLRSVDGGLSHGLLSALSTVNKHGPIRLADLAQWELVSAPSITRIVVELESRKLVTRTVDPADGRAFLIAMTIAGDETILGARSARASMIAQLVEHLDADDAAKIVAALPALERMVELSPAELKPARAS